MSSGQFSGSHQEDNLLGSSYYYVQSKVNPDTLGACTNRIALRVYIVNFANFQSHSTYFSATEQLPVWCQRFLTRVNSNHSNFSMVNAVKVFKKTAPNGKITVYLGRRDFVDNTSSTEPVDGVVVCDNDYLRGRKVFATVTVTYRFGREEDEVMGLHFSKEMQLTCQQIYPTHDDSKMTEVQDRLLKKLGGNAHAFHVNLPEESPFSVQLHPGSEELAKPLGVIYELKVHVADNSEEKTHRRNSVALAVRKVQYSPRTLSNRQPSTLVTKNFTFSPGNLNMEVTLDKEVFYHGEQITPSVVITNNSKKTVKGMKCSIVQHIEVTMTNTQFTREVASLQTQEGCPLQPGGRFKKAFHIIPLASNKSKYGIALDGKMKDTDANLASSTVMRDGKCPNDALGIVVSYSTRIRLNCGALGGELVADLPFKLVHPVPGSGKGEDIVFEDFANLRRGVSVDNQL
ncbi:arrestin homolog [Homarus americanus]|uniref:arrestin homolog n=1 Tax=Homarus americanus TaxID=6706 RepID=UPI001C497BF6|nr:arrestin homolog [Homarus americanus]